MDPKVHINVSEKHTTVTRRAELSVPTSPHGATTQDIVKVSQILFQKILQFNEGVSDY
jgi:hypothetical protein